MAEAQAHPTGQSPGTQRAQSAARKLPPARQASCVQPGAPSEPAPAAASKSHHCHRCCWLQGRRVDKARRRPQAGPSQAGRNPSHPLRAVQSRPGSLAQALKACRGQLSRAQPPRPGPPATPAPPLACRAHAAETQGQLQIPAEDLGRARARGPIGAVARSAACSLYRSLRPADF